MTAKRRDWEEQGPQGKDGGGLAAKSMIVKSTTGKGMASAMPYEG